MKLKVSALDFIVLGGFIQHKQTKPFFTPRRCRQRFENQHKLSDELDFVDPEAPLTSKKQPEVRSKCTLGSPQRQEEREPNQGSDRAFPDSPG